MFALRHTCRRGRTRLLRGNATLQSTPTDSTQIPPTILSPSRSSKSKDAASTSSSAQPSRSPNTSKQGGDSKLTESTTTTLKGRKAIGPRRRPNISLENPRKWNPPLKTGLVPAYDEAVKLIKLDSDLIKKEATGLKKRLSALEGKTADTSRAVDENDQVKKTEVEEIKEKLAVLDVQAYINLPSVRWKAANGMADMSKPVFRHLVEKKWRTKGTLDLLMERIHQMNVIPDLLPTFHPSLDLRLTFPEPPPQSVYLRTRIKRRYTEVEPGVFLLPEQTRRPPRLYTSVFHPETRLYTLVLLDADVPDPENASYTTYLHWLVPNIPLSATSRSPIVPNPPLTSYVPPHPQRGSPYHRYCLFLLPNPESTQTLKMPVMDEAARQKFDLRSFCSVHGIDVAAGGAAHMWREVWDETVSDIYRNTLKSPEPRYTLPPRQDPYKAVKNLKKYSK